MSVKKEKKKNKKLKWVSITTFAIIQHSDQLVRFARSKLQMTHTFVRHSVTSTRGHGNLRKLKAN